MCDFLTHFQQTYSQVRRDERLRDGNGICMEANQHSRCGLVLISIVIELGFRTVDVHPCLFIRTAVVEGKTIVFGIGIFVDVLLLIISYRKRCIKNQQTQREKVREIYLVGSRKIGILSTSGYNMNTG